MIGTDIVKYLSSKTDLNTLLGGNGKIFLAVAPNTAKQPWIVVEAGGGARVKMGQNKQQETNSVRITLIAGSTDKIRGQQAIYLARSYLDTLRGDLYDTEDMIMTVSGISEYPGLEQTYVFTFTARTNFIESYATQRPVIV